MTTKIMSLLNVAHGIDKKELDNFSIISFRDSGKGCKAYNMIDHYFRGRLHTVVMDDVQDDMPCVDAFVMPNEEDIRKALEFAKDKDNIIVHCTAGVSRSSAMAFLVECQKTGDPKEAIRALNPMLHYPNRMIARIGGEILGMEVLPVIDKFNSDAIEACFEQDNE